MPNRWLITGIISEWSIKHDFSQKTKKANDILIRTCILLHPLKLKSVSYYQAIPVQIPDSFQRPVNWHHTSQLAVRSSELHLALYYVELVY